MCWRNSIRERKRGIQNPDSRNYWKVFHFFASLMSCTQFLHLSYRNRRNHNGAWVRDRLVIVWFLCATQNFPMFVGLLREKRIYPPPIPLLGHPSQTVAKLMANKELISEAFSWLS